MSIGSGPAGVIFKNDYSGVINWIVTVSAIIGAAHTPHPGRTKAIDAYYMACSDFGGLVGIGGVPAVGCHMNSGWQRTAIFLGDDRNDGLESVS